MGIISTAHADTDRSLFLYSQAHPRYAGSRTPESRRSISEPWPADQGAKFNDGQVERDNRMVGTELRLTGFPSIRVESSAAAAAAAATEVNRADHLGTL